MKNISTWIPFVALSLLPLAAQAGPAAPHHPFPTRKIASDLAGVLPAFSGTWKNCPTQAQHLVDVTANVKTDTSGTYHDPISTFTVATTLKEDGQAPIQETKSYVFDGLAHDDPYNTITPGGKYVAVYVTSVVEGSTDAKQQLRVFHYSPKLGLVFEDLYQVYADTGLTYGTYIYNSGGRTEVPAGAYSCDKRQ